MKLPLKDCEGSALQREPVKFRRFQFQSSKFVKPHTPIACLHNRPLVTNSLLGFCSRRSSTERRRVLAGQQCAVFASHTRRLLHSLAGEGVRLRPTRDLRQERVGRGQRRVVRQPHGGGALPVSQRAAVRRHVPRHKRCAVQSVYVIVHQEC